jgi:hypothetical protein
MPAPTIEFDGITYTITLFRADEKEYFVFNQHTLSVCAAREEQLESSERSQINSMPGAEGLLYYIHAQPRDLGPAECVGLENKEEALAINRALLFLKKNENIVHDIKDENDESVSEADEENEDLAPEAEEDRGDDMRDWQRETVERDW